MEEAYCIPKAVSRHAAQRVWMSTLELFVYFSLSEVVCVIGHLSLNLAICY
jgi:hypothetical protein